MTKVIELLAQSKNDILKMNLIKNFSSYKEKLNERIYWKIESAMKDPLPSIQGQGQYGFGIGNYNTLIVSDRPLALMNASQLYDIAQAVIGVKPSISKIPADKINPKGMGFLFEIRLGVGIAIDMNKPIEYNEKSLLLLANEILLQAYYESIIAVDFYNDKRPKHIEKLKELASTTEKILDMRNVLKKELGIA